MSTLVLALVTTNVLAMGYSLISEFRGSRARKKNKHLADLTQDISANLVELMEEKITPGHVRQFLHATDQLKHDWKYITSADMEWNAGKVVREDTLIHSRCRRCELTRRYWERGLGAVDGGTKHAGYWLGSMKLDPRDPRIFRCPALLAESPSIRAALPEAVNDKKEIR